MRNMMKQLTVFLICFAVFALAMGPGLRNENGPSAPPGAAIPDPERARLEAALDAAETTPDIAAASYALYQHLDQELQALQNEIRRDFTGQGNTNLLNRFDQSTAHWTAYRETFADTMWELHRGGTIRSWMHNGTLINLTEQRLAHLRGMSPEWYNR